MISTVIIFYDCVTSKPLFTGGQQKEKTYQKELYAIKHVNIIPMTLENKVIENATIVIKDNKIFSINEAVPDLAEIIEGKGK